MTLPDLHPDDLLRRASHDQITPAERADLAAHFRRCPACALELAAGADAARAGVPSEADHAIAARIVERVLASTAAPAAPRVGRRWNERLSRAALIALMLTSTAVGASAIAVRLHERDAAPDRAAQSEANAAAPAPARRTRHSTVAALPDPQPTAAVATAPDVAAAAPDAIVPTPAPAADRAGHPPAPLARARPRREAPDAPAGTTGPLQPPSFGPTAPGLDRADAAVTFARAEEARALRRFGDAARLYDDLARRFPGSREEIVARVLHGQLLLAEMRDPAAALQWFQRYLAGEPTGALAEEARLGRAQALRASGLRDEERAAWDELLRRHPASVHARAARARLAALRAP